MNARYNLTGTDPASIAAWALNPGRSNRAFDFSRGAKAKANAASRAAVATGEQL
jgi:hypothetical protein